MKNKITVKKRDRTWGSGTTWRLGHFVGKGMWLIEGSGDKVSSRKAGWSAVANPQLAREAYSAWLFKEKSLNVNELILARDYSVINQLPPATTEALNADLRNAICKAILGR